MLGMPSDEPAPHSRGYLEGLRLREAAFVIPLAVHAREKGNDLSIKKAVSLTGEEQKRTRMAAARQFAIAAHVPSEALASPRSATQLQHTCFCQSEHLRYVLLSSTLLTSSTATSSRRSQERLRSTPRRTATTSVRRTPPSVPPSSRRWPRVVRSRLCLPSSPTGRQLRQRQTAS